MVDKIKLKSCEVGSDFSKDMKTWLEAKIDELNSSDIYLLSFHDDGVVWGRIDNKILKTSDFKDSLSPKFRSETLQELRLFGENGQLHIWRVKENQFHASIALESNLKALESIEEKQVLYGTKTENDNVGREFTFVTDGSEGLRHAFPQEVSFNETKKRPLRLHVKHYAEYDNDGCARIAFSRLTSISVDQI